MGQPRGLSKAIAELSGDRIGSPASSQKEKRKSLTHLH